MSIEDEWTLTKNFEGKWAVNLESNNIVTMACKHSRTGGCGACYARYVLLVGRISEMLFKSSTVPWAGEILDLIEKVNTIMKSEPKK